MCVKKGCLGLLVVVFSRCYTALFGAKFELLMINLPVRGCKTTLKIMWICSTPFILGRTLAGDHADVRFALGTIKRLQKQKIILVVL
jgi:hypothetical protein